MSLYTYMSRWMWTGEGGLRGSTGAGEDTGEQSSVGTLTWHVAGACAAIISAMHNTVLVDS